MFTAEDVEEFVQLFVVKKATSAKLQPFFQKIVQTGYQPLKPEEQEKFRTELARYVRQYNFISQIMTFVDASLEKFYLFAKLLLKQLPYQPQTLPREVMDMVDMDKYRLQEEQNGSILLATEDATLLATSDDGHRGITEEEREKLKIIVQKLNQDYGFTFEESDRVVNALKSSLEQDNTLRAAFQSDSIEFLKKQKLEDSIKKAFVDNADLFLTFMSKTETDPAFGKFFFSEMFKWYAQATSTAKAEDALEARG